MFFILLHFANWLVFFLFGLLLLIPFRPTNKGLITPTVLFLESGWLIQA